ncbi:hypothetical protein FPOAC1_002518 [Fusarium poae]|uniref:hypothetical protein n=1 Tax=Fusarium poae TaxID=36050 RepID=UPI001CEB36B7|nr:hypothetical protein FPOAC1_002518 [Fusarium poae]KAG8676513.1 hypothetical protein FPOAC1_002518 [Fusarium poae]
MAHGSVEAGMISAELAQGSTATGLSGSLALWLSGSLALFYASTTFDDHYPENRSFDNWETDSQSSD